MEKSFATQVAAILNHNWIKMQLSILEMPLPRWKREVSQVAQIKNGKKRLSTQEKSRRNTMCPEVVLSDLNEILQDAGEKT